MNPSEVAALETFLARELAVGVLKIQNVQRIHGGASRETYSFDAAGRGFILRRDPADSLIETERALEYAAYRSVQNADVPAPRPVALVEDSKLLGSPFFIMERIENAQPASPFAPASLDPHREAIGRDFFSILGRIAAIDPHTSELATVTPIPRQCWKSELDHWAQVIEEDALEPQPIALAAIRRLRANAPPEPRRLSIVHGDYRIGNFLHDGKGAIKAILDWEMAHIGDPHEDLGWALDPLWCQGRPQLAAGMISHEEAIELWEDNADQDFDPERFRWWSLFAALKGAAIWISSARAFASGKNTDPVLAVSAWYTLTRHNQILADRLASAPRGGI